jgi:hypothetical protein
VSSSDSGGEIFLRPDLWDILDHARRLMFSVKIKTNAILIKEAAQAERLAAQRRRRPRHRLQARVPEGLPTGRV